MKIEERMDKILSEEPMTLDPRELPLRRGKIKASQDIKKSVSLIQNELDKLRNWHTTLKPEETRDRATLMKAHNMIVAVGGSLAKFAQKYGS